MQHVQYINSSGKAHFKLIIITIAISIADLWSYYCRVLLFSVLSAGLFVCLRLSDLSSEDDPYLLLLLIDSVRGVHTATE